MPRPGPRPYECVRRAWHSDRHQPMRGSIIQQIFRVVLERHSSATKKNREWQDKLPIVVVKAEEIMYSKANSEAEYMDPGTLWERVNDAINTIIRRDESTETGDLLPPCVEAALNLGCHPVRASRSQRHMNPRSYLNPRTEETSLTPKILDNSVNERNPQLLVQHSGNQLTSARHGIGSSSSSRLVIEEANRNVMQNNSVNNPIASCNFPLHRMEVPPGNRQFIPADSNPTGNVGSVYPLYYGIGTHFQIETPQFGLQFPKNPNPIIVGTPIFPSTSEPDKMCSLQNPFSCERDGNSSKRVRQTYLRNDSEEGTAAGFDLSLRLGLFNDQCMSPERNSARSTDDVDLSSSQEESKHSNLSSFQNKEFSFFPAEMANDPYGSPGSQWNNEGESQNAEAALRKRKGPYKNSLEDQLVLLQPDIRSNQFTGPLKRPGL
ncbi:hypothetical protein NMG60_11013247 [Bertholletia excelsa]